MGKSNLNKNINHDFMNTFDWNIFFKNNESLVRSCAVNDRGRTYYDFITMSFYRKSETKHAELRRFTISIILAGSGTYVDDTGLSITLKPGVIIERVPGSSFTIQRKEKDGLYIEAMFNLNDNIYKSLIDLGLLSDTNRAYEVEVNRDLINKIISTFTLLDDTVEYGLINWLQSFIDLVKDLHKRNTNKAISWKYNLVEQLKRTMKQHQSKMVNLSEFASAFNISSRYLRKIFQELNDESPKSCYLRLKFELACKLLTENQLSIKEIAFKLGYANSQGFCRQFRRLINCSPLDYRKQSCLEKELK